MEARCPHCLNVIDTKDLLAAKTMLPMRFAPLGIDTEMWHRPLEAPGQMTAEEWEAALKRGECDLKR